MLRMVFVVLLTFVAIGGVLLLGTTDVDKAFGATAEEEVALDNLLLKLSTQAVHEARVREEIGYENVYDQTAMAFSRCQCPEYDEKDRPIVDKAFGAAFEGQQLRLKWVQMMSERVSKASDGKAHLEMATGSAILDLMPIPYGVVRVITEYGSTTYVITPTSFMGCEEEEKEVSETKYSLLE